MTTVELIREVEKLPKTEQALLIDHVLFSSNEPSAEILAAWGKESLERVAEWRRGESVAVPYEDVLKRYSR